MIYTISTCAYIIYTMCFIVDNDYKLRGQFGDNDYKIRGQFGDNDYIICRPLVIMIT